MPVFVPLPRDGERDTASKGPLAPFLLIEWLDEAGARIGGPVHLPWPEQDFVETTDGAGGLRIRPTRPSLFVEAGAPAGATGLRITGDGVQAIHRLENLASLPKSIPRPERRIISGAGPTMLWVVSDRFAESEKATFFERVEGMHRYWSAHHQPFRQGSFAHDLAIEALFWPAAVGASNFATPECPSKDRILRGEQKLLERYLAAAGVSITDRPFVVVLINGKTRGGAGGLADLSKGSWSPAWCATASEPGEDWEAIVLHELGHSFGLMDEYETKYELPRRKYEPNVCRIDEEPPWPWSAMLPGPPEHEALIDTSYRAIGRYLGARYSSSEYHRPSATCLMRAIGSARNNSDFCPVCAEVVAREIRRRAGASAASTPGSLRTWLSRLVSPILRKWSFGRPRGTSTKIRGSH